MTNTSLKEKRNPQHWDIFCTVVDNFGDIGVSWRLARQLADEHKLRVRLWIDDLKSFKKICPAINPGAATQVLQDIEVIHWSEKSPFLALPIVADIVIEAFGCTLPSAYLNAMALRPQKPIWLNLEYLSAEEWVDEYHSVASPHPQLPLTKYFFFPGFTQNTGGLLREKNLLNRRNQFRQLKQEQDAFWNSIGIPPVTDKELRISLFAYENPALEDLIQTWRTSNRTISCVIPHGRSSEQLRNYLHLDQLNPGNRLQLGNLSIYILPFLEQQLYDNLLWSCDLNFVRGEDSFVRAQWAGRPFIWHIYPQDEQAHMVKLKAFLDLFTRGMSPTAAEAVNNVWLSWNNGENISDSWPAFLEQIEQIACHMNDWVEKITLNGDISTNLVQFCEKYA